jgi:hypothetical protein
VAVFLQRLIVFRPTFHATWLEAVGTMADDVGGDGRQQG